MRKFRAIAFAACRLAAAQGQVWAQEAMTTMMMSGRCSDERGAAPKR